MKLDGSVVLVTGSNGGLGQHFVEQALRRGASRVYAAARSPRESLDSRVVPLALDVTNPVSIAHAAAIATGTSVVVNNAGVSSRQPLIDTPIEDIRAVYEANVFGPLEVAKAFAPALRARGGGAIVDVLSVMSWVPRPGAFNSSKSAFWSVTNSLRLELAGQGTQVLGAHLSFTETPMTTGLHVPKADPLEIVNEIYDALEAGQIEVLADQPSRDVRSRLGGPVDQYALGLFPDGIDHLA